LHIERRQIGEESSKVVRRKETDKGGKLEKVTSNMIMGI
jgi:hypothetical protein